MNPANQDRDRRGRAHVTRGYTRRSRMEKAYHCSTINYWDRSTLRASFRMIVPPVLIGTSAECNCSKQTRKSPIPVPPIPDLAGERGGNPRFPTRPESGIGKSPVSRFGRDRYYTKSRAARRGISWSGRKCRVVPISTTVHASVRCLHVPVAQMAFACHWRYLKT